MKQITQFFGKLRVRLWGKTLRLVPFQKWIILHDLLDLKVYLLTSKLFNHRCIKKSVFGVILVRIFPAFSRIRTEYGVIVCISPYSVRMRENAGKMQTRITLNTDTFYAVILTRKTVLYSIQYKNLLKYKLGCFWPSSFTQSINLYTFYCHILKSADVWKMWFHK